MVLYTYSRIDMFVVTFINFGGKILPTRIFRSIEYIQRSIFLISFYKTLNLENCNLVNIRYVVSTLVAQSTLGLVTMARIKELFQ